MSWGQKRLRASKHRKIPHFIACFFHRWLIVTNFKSERRDLFDKGLGTQKGCNVTSLGESPLGSFKYLTRCLRQAPWARGLAGKDQSA